ncbi:MAG: TonB-dependent receptor, partial [Fodinibius sp.]|nr:TonB-dependent receptor [Fodinibius sp.]
AIAFSEPTARYQFGNEFVQTLRPEGYNANLKWEETTTYNIGLDYGFFNDRLFGSIEAYYRETNDLLKLEFRDRWDRTLPTEFSPILVRWKYEGLNSALQVE